MSMRTSTLAVCTRPNFRRFVPLRFCVAKIWPGTRLKPAHSDRTHSMWAVSCTFFAVCCECGAGECGAGFSLVPGQIFATQKRNGTKRRKLGLVHTARVLVRMLIPFPRIWGIRNLLYIPATLYRILVRFVKNGRAIILENGVFRVSCCFPRLLLA